jgi:ankyrin repeat protein
MPLPNFVICMCVCVRACVFFVCTHNITNYTIDATAAFGIIIMSQHDVDAFIISAGDGTLSSEDITLAVARGVPVNGRHSASGCTALHFAVLHKRREVVLELLATGADANVGDGFGRTSVVYGAYDSTAEILQLLINGGGDVNVSYGCGKTCLITLVKFNHADAAERLDVLLARQELQLDVTYTGKTAEQWAFLNGRVQLAEAITAEVCGSLLVFASNAVTMYVC